jgi:hypothetical protein
MPSGAGQKNSPRSFALESRLKTWTGALRVIVWLVQVESVGLVPVVNLLIDVLCDFAVVRCSGVFFCFGGFGSRNLKYYCNITVFLIIYQ